MAPVKSRPPLYRREKGGKWEKSKYKMSNHDMKIRFQMTSLLAFTFFCRTSEAGLCVRFGSEVPCSANFCSVRRFGYSTTKKASWVRGKAQLLPLPLPRSALSRPWSHQALIRSDFAGVAAPASDIPFLVQVAWCCCWPSTMCRRPVGGGWAFSSCCP